MASLPPTEGRVPMHSPSGANKRIQEATIDRLRSLASAGPDELGRAICRLQQEWDMERTLELNASIAAGVGLVMGLAGHRGWLWFSVGVLAFLAQHALQGWCPPMPVFRYLGTRTAGEIQDEVTALRMLRGDFAPATAKGASPQQLVEHMVAAKLRTGTFVGAAPQAEPAASTKEE